MVEVSKYYDCAEPSDEVSAITMYHARRLRAQVKSRPTKGRVLKHVKCTSIPYSQSFLKLFVDLRCFWVMESEVH